MPVKDKAKQAALHKIYYEANKDKVKAQVRERNKVAIQRNKDYVNNYLKSHPCVDCGNKNPIVLEFDHVRGEKIKDVGVLKSSSCSLKSIDEEIAKCEVRCANCHRIVTHKRRL